MGYTGHLYWTFKVISFQNRNILLLMDQRATHHQDARYVKYVKIVFLFPKTAPPFSNHLTKEWCVPQAVYIFQPTVTLSLWNLQGHHHHHHGHKNPFLAQVTAIYFCETHFIIIFQSVSVDPGPGNETGQVGQEAVPHASKSYQRRTTGIIFYS